MNIAVLSAAALMGITVLIHIFMGGPEVMAPIRKSSLHKVVRAVADVVWHGVTVVLIVIAAGLAWIAFYPNPALLWALSAIQIGFAGLFIWYGLRHLGSLKPMPQWIIFLAVPALSIWGSA